MVKLNLNLIPNFWRPPRYYIIYLKKIWKGFNRIPNLLYIRGIRTRKAYRRTRAEPGIIIYQQNKLNILAFKVNFLMLQNCSQIVVLK